MSVIRKPLVINTVCWSNEHKYWEVSQLSLSLKETFTLKTAKYIVNMVNTKELFKIHFEFFSFFISSLQFNLPSSNMILELYVKIWRHLQVNNVKTLNAQSKWMLLEFLRQWDVKQFGFISLPPWFENFRSPTWTQTNLREFILLGLEKQHDVWTW